MALISNCWQRRQGRQDTPASASRHSSLGLKTLWLWPQDKDTLASASRHSGLGLKTQALASGQRHSGLGLKTLWHRPQDTSASGHFGLSLKVLVSSSNQNLTMDLSCHHSGQTCRILFSNLFCYSNAVLIFNTAVRLLLTTLCCVFCVMTVIMTVSG